MVEQAFNHLAVLSSSCFTCYSMWPKLSSSLMPWEADDSESNFNLTREPKRTRMGIDFAFAHASVPLSSPVHGHGVGVYRQACSGIPLVVRFVGRDRLLWNSMVQGTQKFRQVRVASCVIPYVLCSDLYCLRCWSVSRGSLPALIYPGGQDYMESPSRVQMESYYNTIR